LNSICLYILWWKGAGDSEEEFVTEVGMRLTLDSSWQEPCWNKAFVARRHAFK
jgi:hypothetical protein